jgi:hypothetical protein
MSDAAAKAPEDVEAVDPAPAAPAAPATAVRPRIFFVVVGGEGRLTLATLKRAIARAVPALDFDAHVVEWSPAHDAKTHPGYVSVRLPVLSPAFLFPAFDVVYIVCSAARLAAVPDRARVVLLLQNNGIGFRCDDEVKALAEARARLAQLDVVVVNWESTLSHSDIAGFLRRGAALVATGVTPRAVDARVAEWSVNAQRLLHDCQPWLPWADFVARVGGSADVARALHDAGCVVALPSLSEPEFAALSLGWLFDRLRHITIPAFYHANAVLRTFMWTVLNVDRQLERSLLDVVWFQEPLQLRDALVKYFETAGVLGPRIPARPKLLPMLGDRWLAPHLIWCGAEPWSKINDNAGVDDWRVPAGALHCLRRRFEVATLAHELWRAVLQRLAALFRIELNVQFSSIKVTSLDDDETLVIMARDARDETLGAGAGVCA